ncbi:hypothetical protein SLEP1_g16251 [Rubroshorea leprosula]|uniref:Glutaredoxin domain-containing protein n=1 Tax=Rubroshorea leprosula TaxID=152421 RepID=A0AAV5IW33_9ROSI|nr:hypothetical protein SLEP1_g16251 [Rubroshorea leprosula]
MGCVSSNLLNQEDEFSQLGGSAFGHHIVSLTSSTYGLLTLDPPQSATTPPTPQPRITLVSTPEPKSLWSDPRPMPSRPEVINSWELMSGLDADSFRFSPLLNKENHNRILSKIDGVSRPPFARSRSSLLDKFEADSFRFPTTVTDKENANPNSNRNGNVPAPFSLSPLVEKFDSQIDNVSGPLPASNPSSSILEKFEKLCPPNGENRVVIYTTTLRGVRKTFEDCNAVRAAIENYGILICERDISMDRGFKEELRELMKGKEKEAMNPFTPPRVFVKGRYIGGADEVMRIVEEGWFGELLKGLPKKRAGEVCEGCGDVKFLPCLQCNGSCKMVVVVSEEEARRTVVVRCDECNENGLVLCPICS